MLVPGRITEKKALKKLAIPDFGQMPIEKISAFANAMPYMDREVALKALSQFPEYAAMEKELISVMKNSLELAYQSNKESTELFCNACNRELDYYYKRLESDSIDSEERIRIENRLYDIRQEMDAKDTEVKEYWLKIIQEMATPVKAGLTFALCLLGGVAVSKISSASNTENEDEEEENPD